MKKYFRFSIISIVFTYLLIFVGGLVRVSGRQDRLADWGGRLSPRDLFGLDVRPCGAVLHLFLSLRLVDIPPGDRCDQLSKEWSLLRDRGSMAIRLALQLFPGCLVIL